MAHFLSLGIEGGNNFDRFMQNNVIDVFHLNLMRAHNSLVLDVLKDSFGNEDFNMMVKVDKNWTSVDGCGSGNYE